MSYFLRLRRVDSIVVGALVMGFATIVALATVGMLADEQSEEESGCGTENLLTDIEAVAPAPFPFVAVVGDGVQGRSFVRDRPYNTQLSQGEDLQQGIEHALKHVDRRGLRFAYIDDGGNPRCAGRIGEILAAHPRLVGVIGHSTTSCTRESLPFYKRSNIPVIIPAATNPALLEGHSSHCFRLPASDDVQSVVMADFIFRKLDARTVFLVWDATPEANQYSQYLKDSVQRYLNAPKAFMGEAAAKPVIEGAYPVSMNPLNYAYLNRRIVSSDADVVVFAGFGSLAREFLFGLDYEYSRSPERPRPRVVLTDGCKIPVIRPFGFDTYIMFPAGPLASFPTFSDFKDASQESGYLGESFEVFGYDAAAIFYATVEELSSERKLSRTNIIDHIRSNAYDVVTSYKYRFVGGENQRHRYYSYSLSRELVEETYEEDEVEALLARAGEIK